MAATRKKSIKRNRAKRVSQFKQGHSALYRKCSDIDEASSSNNNELTDNARVSSFEIQDVLSLVNRAGCSQGRTGADVLPYRLRPGVEKDYSESFNINTAGKSSSSSTQSFSENENIIVNVKKLEELLISFAPHSCESSRSLSLDIVERQGLCVTVTVNCRNCGFETPKCALFTTMKTARGPDAGCVNTMMLIPVLKSRVGLNDLHLFLSCVNIRAPDLRGLQRKLNQLTDKIENLNKKQMLLNQQYVKRIQTFAGLSNESDMEFDVSYNSRPQQGCERATQSFAPLIERTTTRHLPIAIETANKLCTKQKCQHNTNSCKRNYNPHDSIQSTEPKLLKSNLNSVHQQNILKVRSITTDASAQIAKALREYNTSGNYAIKHYKCFIHRMRSLHKQVKNVKLSSVPRGYDKGVYSQKLASCLRARVRLELTRHRKRFIKDDYYVQHARLSLENIIRCFQGKHGDCRQRSMVCEAHLPSYTTQSLPYGQHIKLSTEDIDKIKTVLRKYLSTDCLKEMVKLSNTNQCESIHSQLFRWAPKHTAWSRNFTGLCHSVVHSASLGTGKSILKTAELLKIPVSRSDPFFQHMIKVDSVSIFHGRRQATVRYKSLRHLRRKGKVNRKLLSMSVYGGDQQIDQEHDYGINPTN